MKKIIFHILKFLIAGAILTYLAKRLNLSYESFINIPWQYLALAAICLGSQIILTAARWFYLLRAIELETSFRESLSLTMQGVFFTLFVPGGSVGGDLVKGAMIARRAGDGKKFDAVFSILADRLTGLAGLMIITLLSLTTLYLKIDTLSNDIRLAVYVTTIVCAAALAAVATVFFHDFFYRIAIFKKLLTILDKYSKGMFTRAVDAVTRYRAKWRTLLVWVILSGFVMFPLLAGALYFCALGVLDGKTSDLEISNVFVAANMSNTVAAVPATPGGIGTRDLMAAEILKSGGLPGADADGIPLIYTGIFLIVSLSGVFFFLFDKGDRRKPRTQSEEKS